MSQQQPQAVADRMDARDFIVRLVSVLGMVGVALAILLAVHPA
jgi:hypothetical protein